MNRVAVLGFDAAEWTLIEPLMRAGKMPNLSRLYSQGAHARLHDRVAYRYGLIFQQFLYGREADLSAEWEPMGFDPGSYRASQRNAAQYEGWSPFYAQADGPRTIAFDVPQLRLLDSPSTVEVTSWGASAALYPRASHPQGLLREIDETFGPHPASNNDYECGWWDPDRIARLVDALGVGARRRVTISEMLRQRFAWDLSITVMSEAHSAGEYLWHGVDDTHPLHGAVDGAAARARLDEVHTSLDAAVGLFAASLPPEVTLVVFSPYGLATSPGDTPSVVLLPELLHRLYGGPPLLPSRSLQPWRAAGCPPVVPAVGETWEASVSGSWMGPAAPEGSREELAARLQQAWRRRNSLARSVRSRRDARFEGSLGVPIEPETRLRAADILARHQTSMDWQFVGRYQPYRHSMPAFALPSFSDGLVRLNVVGRESTGVVDASDYQRTCDHIERELRAGINPRTGKSCVAQIDRLRSPQDIFDADGPYADLAVRWDGPTDAVEHPRLGSVGPFAFHRTATHGPNGFAVFCGPGIQPGDLGDRSVIDLPPTLLALLGQSPSPQIDGRSMLVLRPDATSHASA